ncbi:MAG: hypothetical protein U5J64_06955 [Halobacteriales archaeon]|nr:hypothetical protein [Halobacteriales archaeon]
MNGGFFDAVDDVLWGVGWRPVTTVSVFVAVGVLAGYLDGRFGVGTAVFGVVFAGVGVLLPSVRKTGLVASVAAVVVFFGVGTDAVVETARGFGFDARGPAEEVSSLVLELTPASGVETTEPAAVVGGAVAWLSVSSLAGATVGGVVWLVCASYVNRKHAGVRDALVERVHDAGESSLGGDVYTLTNPVGEVRFVAPARRYEVANLHVGTSSVKIHHGSVVDMVSRTVGMGDGTEEVYYDRISSVGYDGRRLRIRTADGEPVNVVTSEKPSRLLDEAQDRLRDYKTGNTEAGRDLQETTNTDATPDADDYTEGGGDGDEAVFDGDDDVFRGAEDAKDLLSGDRDDTEGDGTE